MVEIKEIDGQRLVTMTIEDFKQIAYPYVVVGRQTRDIEAMEMQSLEVEKQRLLAELEIYKSKSEMEISKQNMINKLKGFINRGIKQSGI